MKANKKKRGTQPEAPNNTKPKLLPYKGDTPRVRARVERWRAAFLETLTKTPSVSVAARAAGVSRSTVYDARDRDPAFGEQWDDALAQSIDALEAHGYVRAIRGDSQLTMFYLKAHKPQIYRETLQVDQRLCGVLLLPEKELKEP
jgi:hypothetical protein